MCVTGEQSRAEQDRDAPHRSLPAFFRSSFGCCFFKHLRMQRLVIESSQCSAVCTLTSWRMGEGRGSEGVSRFSHEIAIGRIFMGVLAAPPRRTRGGFSSLVCPGPCVWVRVGIALTYCRDVCRGSRRTRVWGSGTERPRDVSHTDPALHCTGSNRIEDRSVIR